MAAPETPRPGEIHASTKFSTGERGPQPRFKPPQRTPETRQLALVDPLAIDRSRVKSRSRLEESQRNFAGRAVALFGDDQLGFARQVGVVLLVHLFAEDE